MSFMFISWRKSATVWVWQVIVVDSRTTVAGETSSTDEEKVSAERTERLILVPVGTETQIFLG